MGLDTERRERVHRSLGVPAPAPLVTTATCPRGARGSWHGVRARGNLGPRDRRLRGLLDFFVVRTGDILHKRHLRCSASISVNAKQDHVFHDARFHFLHTRIVSDRISTGSNLTKYVPCAGEDIYQERSRSMLAPPRQMVARHRLHHTQRHEINLTFPEGPLVIKANPNDRRGTGYYMYADQKWATSPSGQPMEEQYSPY